MRKALAITAIMAACSAACGYVAVGRISSAPLAQPPSDDGPVEYRYTVQPGDTLRKISQDHYGTPDRWKEIALANGITDASKLGVGKAIDVPGYVPPPIRGSGGRDEPLMLRSPVLHGFPWRVFVRVFCAYLVTSMVIGTAVLMNAASRMGVRTAGLLRAAGAMGLTGVAFASAVLVAASAASLFAPALSGSPLLALGAGGATIASAFGAVVVVMKFSFETTTGNSMALAGSFRFAAMISAAATAGMLYLAASSDLTDVASFLLGI